MDVFLRPCIKLWKLLTEKSKIRAALVASYWFLICVRVVSLEFFLRWRIKHPNEDAIWVSTVSIICEIWFSFTWLLDQLPKLFLVKCSSSFQLDVFKDKFETPNSAGKSNLPGIDVFVSTADPEKEPPLVTANTILSILAADYPIGKLSCYVSDDGGALLTYEAMAEAASFAKIWVPFCRKHCIEPSNPESYFNVKRVPGKTKLRQDFVRDRRQVKREYEEFKVRINGLPYLIQQRSDACNAEEENQFVILSKESKIDEPGQVFNLPQATWMVAYEDNFCSWPGTWTIPAPGHSKGDHASIIQVLLVRPADELPQGAIDVTNNLIDLSEVDTRLPMLVYVSREKHPGFDHNKKAGAMNALLRASAIISNAPFILNLDCDHYINNSQALREGICYLIDCDGDQISYVQFPQRFEGIDPSDRYANHNTVFFDINMRALDGLQGPFYVGTGCIFRRIALYGFDPCRKIPTIATDEEMNREMLFKRFGHSGIFVDSILDAEFQGRLLDNCPSVEHGRTQDNQISISQHVDASRIADAINAISSWYEDKTKWGSQIGWIYGSVTEDVVTGYRMHNRGWTSVYCVPKHGDAFRGTAPCNLTDRLHQVLRWATGSVEIFFSRNNALFASTRMKVLQRIAYLNVGIYPFTSIFLIVYCFIPAISLLSGEFIVKNVDTEFLLYLLHITITHNMLAWLEIKWAGITLEEWWRNEQFWLIGGTSSHIAAVLQGLLKVIAGIEISFTVTSKSTDDDNEDEFADLYTIKWSFLMMPPMTVLIVNLIAIAVGVCQTVYSDRPQWGQLVGGVFFSFWVLAHLYPFAKGLMGKYERTPTIVFVWSGLVAISICLLWAVINTAHTY